MGKVIVDSKRVWHGKGEQPVYTVGGDNRIVTYCRQYLDSKGVPMLIFAYDSILPDGRLSNVTNSHLSIKKQRKYAQEWKHLAIDGWAYVEDLVPSEPTFTPKDY